MDINLDTIEVNGEKYAKLSSLPDQKPNGNRAVVVVDRGWIYAGDVTEENGRIKLTRAVWVFRWESIGFDGIIKDPKSSKAQLRPMPGIIDIPAVSEVFRIPVSENWGL